MQSLILSVCWSPKSVYDQRSIHVDNSAYFYAYRGPSVRVNSWFLREANEVGVFIPRSRPFDCVRQCQLGNNKACHIFQLTVTPYSLLGISRRILYSSTDQIELVAARIGESNNQRASPKMLYHESRRLRNSPSRQH